MKNMTSIGAGESIQDLNVQANRLKGAYASTIALMVSTRIKDGTATTKVTESDVRNLLKQVGLGETEKIDILISVIAAIAATVSGNNQPTVTKQASAPKKGTRRSDIFG